MGANGRVQPSSDIHPGLDSRFDVQVRQALPFMDFSTAKWEMLIGVRNFFRDAAPDQSVSRRAARRASAEADRRWFDAEVLTRKARFSDHTALDPQY